MGLKRKLSARTEHTKNGDFCGVFAEIVRGMVVIE